jgi:hypothetical protein
MNFVSIKNMEGSAAVDGDEIGDIHQLVDRAKANFVQASLKPFW